MTLRKPLARMHHRMLSAVPGQAPPVQGSRGRDAAAILALVALGLVVVAAVLVNVHPMELKSVSSADLFESALKSQKADRAKHMAAEAKLKSQVEGSIAKQDGLTAKNAKPLTDADLFKMAYKSQQADVKKKDAAVAALKAQATKTHSAMPGLPTSKAARLSDAKLFEDALKEQKDERSKNQDALKLDIKAELKQKAKHAGDSLKAQQMKERAELKMILQADGTKSGKNGKNGKPELKVSTHSKPVLKASKARTQSLATVEQHKRHRAARAIVKKAVHVAAPARHDTATKPHVKLPTDSKLYKDALAREGHMPKFVKHKKKSSREALAKAHAAMQKKAAARAAKGQESVAQEKQLVAFLDSAGGSKVKPIKVPKTVTNTDRARKEAKAAKAVEAQKKMRTVVKLAARYRTGRGEKQVEHGGWAKAAMHSAAQALGKGGKDEFRRTEFARADAIEASLIGPASSQSSGASLKARGRTTA